MQKILYYFSPTLLGSVLYVVVAIVLLIATNFSRMINLLTGGVVTESDLPDTITTRTSSFVDMISNASVTSDIATMFFWLILGAITYLIIIFFISFFSEATFSFSSEFTFIHNRSYKKGEFLHQMFIALSLRILAIVMAIIGLSSIVTVIYPVLSQFFVYFLLSPSSLGGLFDLCISLFGMILTLHVIVLLLRLLFFRSRIAGIV